MTTAEKYRQLEKSPVINIARFIFNDLKSNATNTTLEKVIADIKTGKTPSKQENRFYEDDYFDWFKPDEIGSEKYLYHSKDKVSKFAYETKQATIFEPDTILINAIGDVGRISILKKQASSNQQITGIRLKNEVFVDYAYFYLLAHREYFYVDLFQTTLPIVNQKKINTIPFCYPLLEEQKNIVEGLEEIENIKSIDDLYIIENLNWKEDYKEICRNFFNLQFGTKEIVNELTHQLDLIKQLRQAFLREAMQGKLVKSTNTKETGQQLLEKIKAEKAQLIAANLPAGKAGKLKKDPPAGQAGKELPPITDDEIPFEIPEHWVWCRLGEICMKITDGTHHSPTNIQNGKYKYVTAKNIKDEGIDLSNITYVNEQVHRDIFSRCNPEKGDILYIKDGATTGIVTINNLDEEFSMLSSVALLKLPNSLFNKYLMYTMRSPFYYQATRNEMYGVAITRVTLEKIKNAVFPLPPLQEQEQIVAKLEELMAFCDGLEQSIKESQGYNEILLQQVLREALQPKEEIN